jgi:hypothetical protein
VPGGAVAIQSFGDFLGFNPHLHILGTDGCFYGDGMFRVAPRFETKHLEETCPPSLSLRRVSDSPEFRNSETGTRKRAGAKRTKF